MQAQVKHFCATLHLGKDTPINWNTPEDEIKKWIDTSGGARYFCIGRELGASGQTPHLQIYISLNKKKAYKLVCKAFSWHIEIAKGTAKDNSTYCRKEAMPEGFFEYGDIKDAPQGGKEDPALVLSLAKSGQWEEIERLFPRTYLRNYPNLVRVHMAEYRPLDIVRTCYWLVGEPGCGKTRFARNFHESTYFKPANKWFDHYNDQKVIILDDVDHGNAHKIGGSLKRIADRYPVQGEFKGGSFYLKHDVCFVTSNYTIDTLYEGAMCKAIQRRFKEIRVYKHVDILGEFVEILVTNPETVDKPIWLNKLTI